MTPHTPTSELLLEVVTYDPVRRKGFLRTVDHSLDGRVHFALSMLPEEFKRPIIERSRPLNQKRRLDDSAFITTTRDLRRAVVGARFRAQVVAGDDSRWRLVRRTISTAPASASVPLHFWDVGRPEPTYSCGLDPRQGDNSHAFGDSRHPDSVMRFAAVVAPCSACLAALLGRTP
jgi:hypothetical protein